MVSPGIGLPSLTVPLWAAVALALNGLPQPANAWLNRSPAARILPLPAAALVALLFFLNVFNPVASGADEVRKAAANGERYQADTLRHDPRFFDYKDSQHSDFLIKEVLGPLQKAATNDPDDARPHVLLAYWVGELWIINADPGLTQTALVAAQTPRRSTHWAAKATTRSIGFGWSSLGAGRRRPAAGPGHRAGLSPGPAGDAMAGPLGPRIHPEGEGQISGCGQRRTGYDSLRQGAGHSVSGGGGRAEAVSAERPQRRPSPLSCWRTRCSRRGRTIAAVNRRRRRYGWTRRRPDRR